MKVIKSVCFLLVLYFLFILVNPVTASTNMTAYPETNGKAVILLDANSGRVLYERNSHQQLPPASLTKIMTGLLVVENGDLEQIVTVSEYAAATPECTIYLEPGETLTRMELLYGALLPSANDACNALAESMAGSETNFLVLMNQRARELGLQNTHFLNTHGLEAEGHYSSAYDLAILTKKALSYPVFAEVVKTKSKTIPWAGRADEDRILLNQNRLLSRYEGAIGVKTGYTKQAGNCVVGAARRGEMILIAVSMNSSTVYDDLKNMLDFGFDNYKMVTLGESNDFLGEVKVIKGDSKVEKVRPASNISLAATDAEIPYLAYSINLKPSVTAPISQGDILGACKLYLKGEQIGSIDLVAAQTIGLKDSWTEWLSSPLSAAKSSPWFARIVVILLLLAAFLKRKNLENGLKRLLLFLLRNRLPNQPRRRRY